MIRKTLLLKTKTNELKIVQYKWILIYIWCCLISSHCTYCSTISIKDKFSSATKFATSKCPHLSVDELVRTSPVILRALGTHIYTNNYSETELPLAPLTFNSVKIPNIKTIKNLLNTQTKASFQSESVLLTLVPETIYKGASYLKFYSQRKFNVANKRMESMQKGVDNNNRWVENDNDENINSAQKNIFQSSERQLNATLGAYVCFESTLLNTFPTEIIAFGKIESTPMRLRSFGESIQQTMEHSFSHITITGIRRWTKRLENEVWKLLGWDEWSDFSTCSATCGGGLQQRYRRCLLDNPLLRLSHHFFYKHHTETTEPNSGTKGVNYYEGQINNSQNMLRNTEREEQYPHSVISNKSFKINSDQHIVTGLSTLYCEGFNVEQRNCNMFTCNENYYEYFQRIKHGENPCHLLNMPKYIQSFTIMMTVRLENLNTSEWKLFSVSNQTHSLQMRYINKGLVLSTRSRSKKFSLPIEVDLNDFHWHQVAISIQNGDFLSIYVDCLWKKSRIISRHLLSLPLHGQVLIENELMNSFQQFLILSGNLADQQCTNKRKSLDEVKRYFIDTFLID